LIIAVVTTGLEQARHPGIDLGRSFLDYGFWGPIFIVRAYLILVIGVLIGAIVGRAVPSLLLTVALTAATVLAMPIFGRAFQPVVTASAIVSPANAFPLYVESGWLTPDGRFLSNDEAVALAPPGGPPGSAYDWIAGRFQSATAYLPGDRVVAVALQETIVDSVIAVACLATTLAVVRRRRAS
jgi:hypothetical protein